MQVTNKQIQNLIERPDIKKYLENLRLYDEGKLDIDTTELESKLAYFTHTNSIHSNT